MDEKLRWSPFVNRAMLSLATKEDNSKFGSDEIVEDIDFDMEIMALKLPKERGMIPDSSLSARSMI